VGQDADMELRWDAVTIDCRDPERLATFWCELLGVQVRGRLEQYVGLTAMAPGQPRLLLQRTDDPRPAKNSLHLDLHVPSVADLPAAVERAVSLGARPVEEHELAGQTWRTLADPEGNLFCLVAD
jgi:catechol-2,3-dioxygenase